MTKEDDREFQNFDALTRQVLTVSKAEILRREAAHKSLSSMNAKKKGPKRKVKLSSAPVPAAS